MTDDTSSSPSVWIRYSDRDLEIEGTKDGLLWFAEAIVGPPAHLSVEKEETRAAQPYSGVLHRFVVEDSVTKVEVRREDDCLRIAGAKQHRQVLGETIHDLASGTTEGDPRHLHVEYYPGHFYLSETSEPVVVSLFEEPQPSDDTPGLL